jgi:hypothetical protein
LIIGSAGAGIAASSACAGGGAAGSAGKGAAFRSGSSFPSANSSSAGSMVADPPRLNSKSMKSLEIAGSGVAATAMAAATGDDTETGSMSTCAASRLKDTRGPSHPYGTGAAGARLLATAEAMERGGGSYARIKVWARTRTRWLLHSLLPLLLTRCRYGGS